MGIIRALLALTVVLSHSNLPSGAVFVGAENAVQIFYLISGFLISFILHQNPIYADTKTFYLNRALRIYPPYFAVALLTLAASTYKPHFWETFRELPIGATVALAISNVVIVGQDWLLFFHISSNHLAPGPDYNFAFTRGMLMPQSWTLGLELTFYLLAPFILRNRKWMFGLLLGSLTVRGALFWYGIAVTDPWTYRFFPAELTFFIIGGFAHQVGLPIYKEIQLKRPQLNTMLTALTILVIVSYFIVPAGDLSKKIALLSIFPFLLPALFTFQNETRWDKLIGELSYPIYIGQKLVIWTVAFFATNFGLTDRYAIAALNVFFVVIFAVGLDVVVARPVERLRRRLKRVD